MHEREVAVDVVNLEEQTAQLERDLIVKERETLDVLKELETTKNIVEELKLKLQNEASEISAALKSESTSDAKNRAAAEVAEDGGRDGKGEKVERVGGVDLCPSEAPGFILLELKQAKLNLTKTTTDLADIRATVDAYNKRIERERASLERTRQRLSSNTSRISCLESELNQKRQKLEEVKDGEVRDPINITRELQKLSSETEQFKKVGEAARAQVQRALSEIEQTKARIRTAEIRLIAAKKMKAAARASEAVAFAEMKALSCTDTSKPSEDVTLTFEEYSSLISKAREAEEACKGRAAGAMLLVEEANVSKTEILKKVEEATEEVKISKKALEEALSRVETANQGKLAVEEALRVWRSEHGHKRRSLHNSTKFKNPSSLQRKDSRLLDVNGMSLVSDELKPVLRPTLSIGQILSRKLLLTEDYENGVQADNKIVGKRKVSLGQMLGKPSSDSHSARKCGKENKQVPAKRKKFGFARISLLVAKKKKSNVAADPLRRGSA
ncbi:WEB family protein At2g38370 isoform X2 [Salvia miltiorrhiza]|uniref:WEB family protein At2g38370 isoform X2 n=1 Tax=Salvia miltiorrhiza TaxID=226208 RepID=UPI0025ACEB54|nr:WEB family protein At2g38370 isoform X2 [Salvia miltiorrhiza]